ncbi:MAG: polyphosphate kinase 2, partial [Rhodocyclaceae bacterium]|nr:polyphosphate kinase 2 [Rhodocyclaceae bacterium]
MVAPTRKPAAKPTRTPAIKPRAPRVTAKPAAKPVSKPRVRAASRPVSAGDIAPATSPAKIENYAVGQAADAAQEARLSALRDIIAGVGGAEARSLLRTLLKEQRLAVDKVSINPDHELTANWRKGGYPYKNLMTRRSYEQHKYRLQVELLKLQAWVKETGQKVVILFEGRDA